MRGRGGRPKGSGNRVQMAPRPPAADPTDAGTAKFSLRSDKYTGVYRSRRSQEGWRAQFCYANKVSAAVGHAVSHRCAWQGVAGRRRPAVVCGWGSLQA